MYENFILFILWGWDLFYGWIYGVGCSCIDGGLSVGWRGGCIKINQIKIGCSVFSLPA